MTEEQKAVAAHATEAISTYQWRQEKLAEVSRHLAVHIAKRPQVERDAFARLSVGEKPPTKTWIEANMDLDAAFAEWRQQRNQYEADLMLEQGKTRVAELQAMLAVALVAL